MIVKSSYSKHESDIPTFEVSRYLETFLHDRKALVGKASDLFCGVSAESRDTAFSFNALHFANLDGQDQVVERLFKVEKRFVIHGDVNSKQVAQIEALKACSEIEVELSLTYFLLTHFEIQKDFNSLNSAVRLIDHLSSKIYQEEHKVYAGHFIELIELETTCLFGGDNVS
ncbi:hypothetical protein [Pseudoalteromonas sp. OOF1S-7]|uniref:hypothetical protein n=1 Tax=Pseudoalteromonas sp. OOF1S-7 TaxID=2917757 RepID=UPI001EF5E0A4|nr:hypothetical protein [Pseudoalteromonas sp. OOF1S-7]MCG7537130.1 hypothetical protein [Pseudoalteromonas sp. OOF1S-7]